MSEITKKSYEKTVSEVLSRFSVQDLVEQTEESLARGDELFYNAVAALQIINQGETSLIKWWKVQSGEKTYECRRFRNFVFCSCPGFFYNKTVCCKHISITAGVYCQHCRVLRARVGKLCSECDHVQNHFLKPAAVAVVSSR